MLSGMSVRELNQIGHRFEAKHNNDSDRTIHQDKNENLTLKSSFKQRRFFLKMFLDTNITLITINQLKKRSENMDQLV